MFLVQHYSSQIQALPLEIQADAELALQQLDDRLIENQNLFSKHPQIAESLVSTLVASRFIVESILRSPELICDDNFLTALLASEYRHSYAPKLAQLTINDEASLMRELRLFRRQEMMRIAWRDLAGWAALDETLQDLTVLAESCIQFALAFLYQQACSLKGTPVLSDGTPFNMVVLGMGKLGANELNYSSDIDLIFAYAENGTLADRQETSYSEFFTRIARNLIKVLDAMTVDGFVFRTDVRLRPFGDSGPLLMTFDGMENYYQTQAREWERYAMVKVRQVAGDFATGKQLMAMFQPFVYRKYLDYGAIDELRNLKYKITQELQRKDRMENVKLGPGGIREIEFIGQAFQLIRGGQEKKLQQRGILTVLQTLAELQLLKDEDALQLQQSYVFLRRVENHIQQYEDLQTHDLPDKPKVREILAFSMGFANWESFKVALDQVRSQVHQVFDQVFALSKQATPPKRSQAVWLGQLDDDTLQTYLADLSFNDVTMVAQYLQHFKTSAAVKRLTNKGAAVLDRLLPQLLETMQCVDNPDVTLKRLLDLLEDVAGRNVYLSLLEENPDALTQLIKLSAASPWICEYLGCYPSLFDELLDARSLYEPLSKAKLAEELQRRIRESDVHDVEQIMILLRKFKQINVLKVAAADIMDVIPIMVVSDYLTYIAEVVLAEVVRYAWDLLVHKHGVPPGIDMPVAGFAILGYGKLGGFELGYGSDLDLVFLYDCADGLAMTEGDRPITCTQFYGRLGQQVRHIMDTRMLSGILYETDLRLRPNGDSGLLVSNVHAYAQYLQQNAWTWEHQALVRARFITGDQKVQQQFAGIRKTILSLPREEAQLKAEVREMREKMRQSLMEKDVSKFDLKQGKGGIADIEFIVQFGILAHAEQNSALVTYTDNIRLLEALANLGFMSTKHAAMLKQAYCAYRDLGHKQALQGCRAVVEAAELAEFQAEIKQIWQILML